MSWLPSAIVLGTTGMVTVCVRTPVPKTTGFGVGVPTRVVTAGSRTSPTLTGPAVPPLRMSVTDVVGADSVAR